MARTKYVVLRNPDSSGFTVVAHAEAMTPRAAIEDVVTRLSQEADFQNGQINGTFVAVPERSWKPMPVKAQQELTFKVG